MNIHRIVIPTPYAVGDVNAFLVKGDALTLFDAGPKTEEASDRNIDIKSIRRYTGTNRIVKPVHRERMLS